MNNQNRSKLLLSGTALSILVFFSISFLTVLAQIIPFHYYGAKETYKLDIGFPFKFYGQFWLRGNDIPNSGWTIPNLFYDCLLTWLVVTGLYYIAKRKRDRFD
ncbi:MULTISPECIES: hypothetical protein [unclassified Flavobacterium]|uniref:hypothetical protein n=1 Tax=unclassified Flavobacterium TaxID=196869 RepID=UPI001F129F66|nr:MULTISPECIES: hypothetical protein [unclassified Flavobacterium]UMY65093.1 hypothetical protein MKO97_11305 [Flavobacterium sp. HJ-32-4]